MKKSFIFIIFLAINIALTAFANIKKEGIENNKIIKNNLFSIEIPNNLKNTYIIKSKKDYIFVYDKSAKKSGFGGLAFGVKAYKNPADHAMMPGGTKIGELIDKKNKLYDVVLIQPTDVQYDYTKSEPEVYKHLYDLAYSVNIKGVKGSKYIKNQGMKGEDLYSEVFKKHLKAIKEKWDSIKLEEENMSYMYNVIAQTSGNIADNLGYAYYDTNGDGIEELLIGEIVQGEWKGIIYDIYTIVDRKPAHVVSGGSRDRYFVCNDVFICNEYSAGAKESGKSVYILVENSTELFPQVAFKYDGYKNEHSPWFISYDINNDSWENFSKKEYQERIKVFNNYKRFDFIPLSQYKIK